MTRVLTQAAALLLALITACAAAAEEAEPAVVLLPMQVRGERDAAPVRDVPNSFTSIGGDELRARGATDLRGALALAAGVDVAPGGDDGPAAAAPGLLAQRETDDFMLAIDGVPVGGVFSAPFSNFDLAGVERIEILRGASPVIMGAGAFAGVINVVHYAAGSETRTAQASGGSHGSYGADARIALAALGAWQQALTASEARTGFSDPRQRYTRTHLLYRGGMPTASGEVHVDVDGLDLCQRPGSPASPGALLDANHNPADAKIDERRARFTAGFEQRGASGDWSGTLSASRARTQSLRGFLRQDAATPGDPLDPLEGVVGEAEDAGNASGFRQQRRVDDLYADTHLSRSYGDSLGVIYGADFLYGRAHLHSETFGYDIAPSGANAPSASMLAAGGFSDVDDARETAGLYSQLALRLPRRVHLYAGLRANYARDALDNSSVEDGVAASGNDRRSNTRVGAVAGASWRLLRDEEADDGLLLYADYRGSAQPAQLDFGPEVESRRILAPETTVNVELGLKSILLDGKLELDLSLFAARFRNLVLAQQVNGQPALVNGGSETFRALQLEGGLALAANLHLNANISLHQARYDEFITVDESGNPLQLQGRELPLSPRQLASLGLVYAPAQGLQASLVASHRGHRFLDPANSRAAGAYTTVDAGAGWRLREFELRLTGENLGDRRDPVALSELGSGQLYLMPARRVTLSLSALF